MLYDNLLRDLRVMLPKLRHQLNKTGGDINKFFSSKPKPKSTVIESTEFFSNELKKLSESLIDLRNNINNILKQIHINKDDKKK